MNLSTQTHHLPVSIRETPKTAKQPVQLDLFYVTASHRGRGIARHLLDATVDLAELHGARGVYISAMPSRNTVGLYRYFGAELAPTPDPRLLAMEPDDIHLVLWLEQYRRAEGSERAG